jgi:uncharacterized surface protein with fasciclin (FAS1) repeats
MRTMRTTRSLLAITLIVGLPLLGCSKQEGPSGAGMKSASEKPEANIPPLNPKNIVSLAMKSKDHTTLVTAIKAARYVTSVAASGPLTVFAPTNDAFAKLPDGTVEGLLKPEKVDDLREILKYHVTTSALDASYFTDGQSLAMANGAKAKIGVKDGKITINGANVIASYRASNGMLHIIDAVLLPPKE